MLFSKPYIRKRIEKEQVDSNLKCSNCGKEVTNEDAVFCPYCAKSFKEIHKNTPLPIAAGVLTTLSSCIIVVAGILSLVSSLFFLVISYDYKISISFVSGFLLFTGILGIISFAFGLTGGVSFLKRTRIITSTVGLSLLIVSGILFSVGYIWIAGLSNDFFSMSLIWIAGIIASILSIIGLVFVAVSRAEFK